MKPYKPVWASLKKHTVPKWYDNAKFGIFIHWGPYSVPAWAPPTGELGKIPRDTWFKYNPYAEWYLNSLRIVGSPTWEHHREIYGENFAYENFVDMWKAESWNPDEWIELFKKAGAKYIIPTTKHHDGFCLWPSEYTDYHVINRGPNIDIIGTLSKITRKKGLKFGVYYSGPFDWQFTTEPLEETEDSKFIRPHTYQYSDYAYNQFKELIDKYEPDILWNDIGWPEKSRENLKYLFAHFYNKNPEGVVNDRWEVGHWDFTTAEYHQDYPDKILPYKWEFCRGLGYSFGYNQIEKEEHTLSKRDLIYTLAEVVSKGGNFLLNIGPKADGTIPKIQKERLIELGSWLKLNGDSIYGTKPWKEVKESNIKFTRDEDNLYAIIFNAGKKVIIKDINFYENTVINLLETGEGLRYNRNNKNEIEISIPKIESLQDEIVLKITPIPHI